MAVKSLRPSDLLRVAGVSNKQYRDIAWHTTEVTIKKYLGIQEIVSIIDTIVNSCFVDGEFTPHLLELYTRKCIVENFSFIEFPESIEDCHYILFSTDLYQTICKYVDSNLLKEILDGVSAYVNFIK